VDFNPLAWQFLFVIAAYFGFRQAAPGGVPTLPGLLPAAAMLAAVGGIVQVTTILSVVFDLRVRPIVLPLWAVDKTPLPPLRLLSMLALATWSLDWCARRALPDLAAGLAVRAVRSEVAICILPQHPALGNGKRGDDFTRRSSVRAVGGERGRHRGDGGAGPRNVLVRRWRSATGAAVPAVPECRNVIALWHWPC